jgi:hypothetical protein
MDCQNQAFSWTTQSLELGLNSPKSARPHGVDTEWNSNSNKATSHTSYYINLKHNLGSSRLYAFYVTMSRSNPKLDLAFSGIDFVRPPIP